MCLNSIAPNNGYMYAHQKAITISKENYFNQTFGGQDNENRS